MNRLRDKMLNRRQILRQKRMKLLAGPEQSLERQGPSIEDNLQASEPSNALPINSSRETQAKAQQSGNPPQEQAQEPHEPAHDRTDAKQFASGSSTSFSAWGQQQPYRKDLKEDRGDAPSFLSHGSDSNQAGIPGIGDGEDDSKQVVADGEGGSNAAVDSKQADQEEPEKVSFFS